MEEIWIDIENFSDYYQVSNHGRVRSKDRECFNGFGVFIKKSRILKQSLKGAGYSGVGLWKDGEYYQFQIHRLVAKAFIDNPFNKPTVNHIDGDKLNNNVSNLEWATRSENSQHAFDTGLMPKRPKVLQYDMNMNFIKEFDSCSKASKETGITLCQIFDVCNGRRNHAHKFIWRFKKEAV